MSKFSMRLQKSQIFGLFALFGISIAIIKLAIALAAFAPQNQPTGYVAQDEVTNYRLTSGNETLYRPEYEKEYWSGNLYAYPVAATGTVNTGAERWTGGAKEQIDAQNWDSGRLIATMKDDGTKVAFRAANLSGPDATAGTQMASLKATINGTAYDSTAIVNYLRGLRTAEATSNTATSGLRKRSASSTGPVLGDTIHSRPYYVSDTTYPTVFVGSNDGMLHAINTSTGAERWAYVPSMLISKLKTLAYHPSDTLLPFAHDYFVDGQINIGNISISGTSTRVLVGGLGAGGKGLYALDISSLTAADEAAVASKILWEITPTKVNYATPQVYPSTATASAYYNLGYVYGTPLIGKIDNGGTQQDVIIVGNGYNDNSSGDYQAYLFVIDAATGKLVTKILADTIATTNGSAASPNGLFNPVALDTDADGNIDLVYAGDLNGTMWKFDLSSTTVSVWSASVLLTTSPVQPITSTPGVAVHPNGGYMVAFGTGAILATANTSDASVHYVYGIWDRPAAYAANDVLLTQTLAERSYTYSGTTTRVRRSSANAPTWTAGAANHKGWKVALPAGERVVGEGSFIESSRFYFNGHNPTVSYLVPDTTTTVYGENWLMELNYLTGGSSSQPFLDMNDDLLLNDSDRIKYIASDAEVVAGTKTVDTAITSPNEDGIIVGKWLSRGVQSQPILVQLTSLNTTLFNQNPDVAFPPAVALEQGVTGGHFDQDIYHGCTSTYSGATTAVKATATITVGSTGQTAGLPATLGIISVDGVTVFPALTIADITNGTDTSTNATTIKNKVTGSYTATVSSSTVTVSAPTAGTAYNGKTFVIAAGTSQAGSAAVAGTSGAKAVGSVTFTYAGDNTSKNVSALTITANGETLYTGAPGDYKPKDIDDDLKDEQSTHYKITGKNYGNNWTIKIEARQTGSAWNGPVTVSITTNGAAPGYTKVDMAGGTDDVAGTPATGWTNFAPALTTVAFSGGVDASTGTATTTCSPITTWQSKTHVHQYDDKYDKTGVNMLNASNTDMNLANAIGSTSTAFKVIAQNQYLSPAVKIHIGNASYLYNVNSGYISVKDFVTSANVNTVAGMAALPTYTRANVGSLAINMPTDALTSKDWWGNGDVRSGLHPTVTGCVKKAAGTTDGNMYQPVIPPVNGVDGPGTNGYSGATTPLTATGARHNGALVIQIIKDTTPAASIEENVAGRPEYGWRVKSADYNTYVLAEYTTFWHHPNGLCYGVAGWTKAPVADTSSSTPVTPAAGSTDPKIGDLSGSGGTVDTVVTVGDTTTITYTDGTQATIRRTANADGTVTIITRDVACIAAGAGCTGTTEVVANTSGNVLTGGDERGSQAKTGRVSWHELIRQ